jgi:energy-coupling factor transporter ATP-binding protein EcfA2
VPASTAGAPQPAMAPPQAEPTNFVTLDRVSLRYGEDGTLALAETTLAVATGEFVAVVGPSGCGKSSLMKVVTGLVPPSEAASPSAGAPLQHRCRSSAWPSRTRRCYLHRKPALPPPLRQSGQGRIESKADQGFFNMDGRFQRIEATLDALPRVVTEEIGAAR